MLFSLEILLYENVVPANSRNSDSSLWLNKTLRYDAAATFPIPFDRGNHRLRQAWLLGDVLTS